MLLTVTFNVLYTTGDERKHAEKNSQEIQKATFLSHQMLLATSIHHPQ